MSYKEIVRRSLEIQGHEEWLGPKALLAEKEKMENYLQKKKAPSEDLTRKTHNMRRN